MCLAAEVEDSPRRADEFHHEPAAGPWPTGTPRNNPDVPFNPRDLAMIASIGTPTNRERCF
jgi:hypothetical protein